jgi:hypothetical protein
MACSLKGWYSPARLDVVTTYITTYRNKNLILSGSFCFSREYSEVILGTTYRKVKELSPTSVISQNLRSFEATYLAQSCGVVCPSVVCRARA